MVDAATAAGRPNPLDLVLVAHDAFRHDLTVIDRAAGAAAHGAGGTETVRARCQFFREMLAWHAHGEDIGIFPVLAPAAPHIIAAYDLDHRGLDLAMDGLSEAIATGDPIDIARATAACKFHLDMHLYKEEVDMYAVFAQVLTAEEQASAVAVFTDALPVERFGDFVRWLFPLVDVRQQERVARVWHAAMPLSMFTSSMRLVEDALGDQYRDLTARLADIAPADRN